MKKKNLQGIIKKKKNYSLRDSSGAALKVSVESRSVLRHFRGNATAPQNQNLRVSGRLHPPSPATRRHGSLH